MRCQVMQRPITNKFVLRREFYLCESFNEKSYKKRVNYYKKSCQKRDKMIEMFNN